MTYETNKTGNRWAPARVYLPLSKCLDSRKDDNAIVILRGLCDVIQVLLARYENIKPAVIIGAALTAMPGVFSL